MIFGKILCKKLLGTPETAGTEGGHHQILVLVDEIDPFVRLNVNLAAVPLLHLDLPVQLLHYHLYHLIIHLEVVVHLHFGFSTYALLLPGFVTYKSKK